MTKTTNYQLNQWAKSDRVMMDDFNADNTKIDAALKANADTAAAASAAVALCGNCAIYQTTYTGGDMTTPTITCPGKPMGDGKPGAHGAAGNKQRFFHGVSSLQSQNLPMTSASGVSRTGR